MKYTIFSIFCTFVEKSRNFKIIEVSEYYTYRVVLGFKMIRKTKRNFYPVYIFDFLHLTQIKLSNVQKTCFFHFFSFLTITQKITKISKNAETHVEAPFEDLSAPKFLSKNSHGYSNGSQISKFFFEIKIII